MSEEKTGMKRSIGWTTFLVAIAISATPNLLSAQTHQPYAGLEARLIKALSDEQIADLRAGRGMGLALPAELNGYPGPVHVLELAESIQLSDAQRTKVQELFDAMQAEAVPLGEKLISQEGELDRLFAGRTVTEASLAASTRTIGATQAELRAAHLKYHLATLKVLTPAQSNRYMELRGYAGAAHGQHRQGGHRH
jgi:Spy/CpxP family protein refolding chaperone